MGRNLGPLNIKDSYEGLVQISGSQLTNGSGSLIPSLEVTSSYATTASYAENAGASTLQQVLDTGNNATGSIVLKNNEASLPALQINSPTGTSSTLLRLSRLSDDAPNFVVTAGDASNATLLMGSSGGFGQISLNGSGANKIQATTKLSIDTPSLTVTGALTASSLRYPTADGTVGQVVTTDGSGNLTLEDAAGGAAFPFTGSAEISGSLVVNNTEGILFTTKKDGVNQFRVAGTTTNMIIDLNGSGSQDVVLRFGAGLGNNIIKTNQADDLYVDIFNGDLVVTSSVADTADIIVSSGSVTATTYFGDGSNLTGVVAGTFPYTGSADITGSLTVDGTLVSGTSTNTLTGLALTNGTAAIIGGDQNTNNSTRGGIYTSFQSTIASGTAGVVVGGQSNQVSGNYYGGVFAGSSNDASGIQAVVLGGGNGTASGASSVIAGGNNNTASHQRSAVLGGTGLSTTKDDEVVVPALSTNAQVKGNVVVLTSVASATTMDCSLGNFFTLAMPSGGFTNLTATNITAGQTISVKITQNATPSSLSFAPAIVFDNASPFVVSTGAGFVDVITFISFDGTSLQATGLKNFQ